MKDIFKIYIDTTVRHNFNDIHYWSFYLYINTEFQNRSSDKGNLFIILLTIDQIILMYCFILL